MITMVLYHMVFNYIALVTLIERKALKVRSDEKHSKGKK